MDVNAGIAVDKPLPSQQPAPAHEAVALCVTCPDEPLPAEFICVTCPNLGLCSGCKNKHLTRKQDHEAVPIKESKDAMCTKHPNKHVEFCCVDPCHALICATCGLLEHTGHKFSPLAEAAERSRAELERAEAQATATADASFAAVTKIFEDCVAFVAGKHELVKTEGRKLIRVIEQMMAQADVAIDTIMLPELQRLGREKEVARGMLARVSSHIAVSRRLRDSERCSHAEVFRLSPVSE